VDEGKNKAFLEHLKGEGKAAGADVPKQLVGSTLLRAWTRGRITTAQILAWADEFGPWLPESGADSPTD
jgi:hypothetical protein